MFNIGGGELIVILLIALIVLGPQRLPDAARQLGKAMGDLRRLSSGFQNEMKQALETADDPNRISARRNVLSAEVEPTTPEPEPEVSAAVSDSIAAVSSQPSAPGKQDPPPSQERSVTRRSTPEADSEASSDEEPPPASSVA